MSINPKDASPHEVYLGEARNFADTNWQPAISLRRRAPDARDGDTWLVDWLNVSVWMRDDQVRNLVRLVPSRPVTRDDLPRIGGADVADDPIIDATLDTVLDHLNAHGGVPSPAGGELTREEQSTVRAMIEQRDEAVQHAEQLARMCNEADMKRNKWRERAETAERDYAECQESLIESDLRWTEAVRECDEWRERAEKAEARTAPTVAREDVETTLNGAAPHGDPRWLTRATDAVWSLLHPTDPVEAKARGLFDRLVGEPWDSISESHRGEYRAAVRDILDREATS